MQVIYEGILKIIKKMIKWYKKPIGEWGWLVRLKQQKVSHDVFILTPVVFYLSVPALAPVGSWWGP